MALAKRKEATRWYINPRGDVHTNEVIAREFDGAIAHKSVPCKGRKGEIRDLPLWEVSYADVRRLEKAHEGAELVLFHIYKRKGDEPAERWRFTSVKHDVRAKAKASLAALRKGDASKAP